MTTNEELETEIKDLKDDISDLKDKHDKLEEQFIQIRKFMQNLCKHEVNKCRQYYQNGAIIDTCAICNKEIIISRKENKMPKISIPKREGKKLILFTAGKTKADVMEFMNHIETMVKDPKIKCVCVDTHMVKSWCYVDETTILEMKNENPKIEPKPLFEPKIPSFPFSGDPDFLNGYKIKNAQKKLENETHESK